MKTNKWRLNRIICKRYSDVYPANFTFVNRMFKYAQSNYTYSFFHKGISLDPKYRRLVKWRSQKQYDEYVKRMKFFMYRCFKKPIINNANDAEVLINEINALFNKFEGRFGLKKSYDG